MKSIIRNISCTLCFGVSLASTVIASDGQSTWTVDDVLSAEWASDYKISPGCEWVAWVKSTPDKDKGESVGNLFLSSMTKNQEIQLTRGSDGCSSPKWSPDGRWIAFLSSRPNLKAKADDKEKTQIWLINPFGGEPWALTSGDRAVYMFDWASSNDIIYSAQEEPSAYEQTLKDRKDFTQVVEDEAHEPPVRLFKVEATSGKVTRLTDNEDRISEFAVSPDATQLVTIHNGSLKYSYDRAAVPITFLTDLKTGKRKQIFAETKFGAWCPRW